MVDRLEKHTNLRIPESITWRLLSAEEQQTFRERFDNESHGFELVDRALSFKFNQTDVNSATKYIEPIAQVVRDTSHNFSLKGQLLIEAVASQSNEATTEALVLIYVSKARGDTLDVIAGAAMRLSGAYLRAKGLPAIPTFPFSNSPTLQRQ